MLPREAICIPQHNRFLGLSKLPLLNIGVLEQALKMNTNVEDVDVTTVWGQGHLEAERTGDHFENFIE